MKKLTNFIFSTRLMSIVIVLFAVAMATATFIENDYGTQTAKALIYNTKWFELLMFLLMVNFIGNIFKYKLYRKEKWSVLLFHLAFILTLFGAFVTRYFGYEGMMPIREGAVSNTILSDKTYVQLTVDDGKEQKEYNKKVLFGALKNNRFSVKDDFRGKDFEVNYVDYIPNLKSVFVEDDQFPEHLQIVLSIGNSRKDIYLKERDVQKFNNFTLSFNKEIKDAISFIKTTEGIFIKPPFDGTFLEMQTNKTTPIYKDSIVPLEFLKLYKFSNLSFVIPKAPVKGQFKQIQAPISEKNKFPFDALYLQIISGDKKEQLMVQGAKNALTNSSRVQLNGLNFSVRYGAKKIETPFSIKLKDFELERYPGSNSPSSYASEVSVIDIDKTFDFRIFMNHVLDYKGYRFFQSSYDPDEKGTILSVNHDYWGTLITYIGYFLMAIGMFFTLFIKGTRFKTLSNKLKKLAKNKVGILLILLGLSTTIWGQEPEMPLKNVVDKNHASAFGKLLIQDHQGRIKPVNTYALEALRKVYKKNQFKGLTAEQVLLSAQLNPELWETQNIIKAKHIPLGNKITKDLKIHNDYTTLTNIIADGKYYLQNYVTDAFRKKGVDKTGTDKEILNLDERVNIWWNLIHGNLMNLYPKRGDSNDKWYSGNDIKAFVAQDTMVLKMHQLYLNSLQKAIKTNDYTEADEYLGYIAGYQKDINPAIIPSNTKIDFEIKYNKWDIFKKLLFYYMIIGFLFLALAFLDLFKPNSKITNLLLKIFSVLTLVGLLAHVIGMGIRWYVSRHEPWSNGYEAIVFVAFVTILAGLIFSKNKSKFTLASTVLFASFLLGIAHGSMMSPEMTNLVPVLKSYWLMIHVAVITASYGFLGLGALLGFVVLLLYILRNKGNAKRFNHTINELTYINESALTVGLFTLTIGTFLGGVWASESWGRYWSWDPKEVWSLISMMVYIFVLHMRLVPGLKGKFAFNVASLFSIATLIMTFFGVNYYLSGMHSYAAGDPVPIPKWIYFAIAFFVLFTYLSYLRYKTFKKLK